MVETIHKFYLQYDYTLLLCCKFSDHLLDFEIQTQLILQIDKVEYRISSIF
jgi:hypothetical protein